jgi:hypothetical protein
MKRLSAVAVVGISLSLLSCATAQPPEAVTLPAARIVLRGYSFQPLQEQGWLVLGRKEEAIILAKRGSHLDESIGIRAGTGKLERAATQQGLVDSVRTLETVNPKDARMRNPRVEVTPATRGGAPCAVSDSEVEDHGALTASGRRDPMVIQTRTIYCRHSASGDAVVFLSYSHRHYQEDRDPAFPQRAQAVLDSLEIGGQ